MQDDRSPRRPHRSLRVHQRPEHAPSIEIRSPDDAGTYTAVIALRGEHDLSTSEALRVALASVTGRVLVDLTACSFLDPTIIGVILTCTNSSPELLLPHHPSPVARVLDLLQIREVVRTHDTTVGAGGKHE